MTRKNETQLPWSQKETDTLRLMWEQGKTAKEITAFIPRSQHAIWTKAKKIKLKRPNKKAISTYREIRKATPVKRYVDPEFTGGKPL